MISEFVCLCHGRMVDPDTGDPSRVMLKYGKNYYCYWTGENSSKHLEEVRVTFLNIHGGALPLYIFDNSSNNHKIATDALNAKEINLKDREKNTPILRDGFYIDQNGQRVVHTMHTVDIFQKGLKMVILERGLWRDGMKKEYALPLLLQQDDFDPTKLSSILDEALKRLGAWLDFVPKYHLDSISLICICDIPRGRLEPSVTMNENH